MVLLALQNTWSVQRAVALPSAGVTKALVPMSFESSTGETKALVSTSHERLFRTFKASSNTCEGTAAHGTRAVRRETRTFLPSWGSPQVALTKPLHERHQVAEKRR